MNAIQLMLIMQDLMMDIKFGMRMTNPNRGLSRLKNQYKSMLGLPKNTKNRTLFEVLWDCAVLPNQNMFQEGFLTKCQDFLETNEIK